MRSKQLTDYTIKLNGVVLRGAGEEKPAIKLDQICHGITKPVLAGNTVVAWGWEPGEWQYFLTVGEGPTAHRLEVEAPEIDKAATTISFWDKTALTIMGLRYLDGYTLVIDGIAQTRADGSPKPLSVQVQDATQPGALEIESIEVDHEQRAILVTTRQARAAEFAFAVSRITANGAEIWRSPDYKEEPPAPGRKRTELTVRRKRDEEK